MQLLDLYRQMARARAFEVAVAELWQRGLISGEMHLGTGEEAVAAGVVTCMQGGDGLALTHRCSPALVVRGLPLVPLLRELLGKPDGICRGCGGHMHVFSREHLAATSGIVGASAPLGAGFALAAKRLRPGSVGVAFTGDGAMNQGMLLETLNLAAAWSLPLLLICVDNGWAITTRAGAVTGGDLRDRVQSFGWRVESADGSDVEQVRAAAAALFARCRQGLGPACLYVTCPRLDGHFLGDPLLDQARHPTGAAATRTLGQVLTAALEPGGGGPVERAAGLAQMVGALLRARRETARADRADPLCVAERALRRQDAQRREIEAAVDREIEAAVAAALGSEVGHA